MTPYEHQDVLNWVNRIRDTYSIGPALDALPLGRPCSCWECPIARALGGADVCASVELKTGEHFELDGLVSDFIDDFDTGRYPELEA